MTTMNAAVLTADMTATAGEPSLEKERARFDGWLVARTEFLEALRDLTPPASLSDLHTTALAVVAELRDATARLADVAHSANTLAEMAAAMQAGPRAAYEEADQRALALCLEVQDAFIDRLQHAVAFTSPWLQTSSAGAADVNLGCAIVQ